MSSKSRYIVIARNGENTACLHTIAESDTAAKAELRVIYREKIEGWQLGALPLDAIALPSGRTKLWKGDGYHMIELVGDSEETIPTP
jgi:hypothetical protein